MLLREQSKFQGSIYRVSSERERESERAPALDHRRRQKRSGREEDGGGRRPGEDAGRSVACALSTWEGRGRDGAPAPPDKGGCCFGAMGAGVPVHSS